MHPQLLDMLAEHPGLLLPDLHQRPLHHRRTGQADAASSATSRRSISVEGTEIVSDERRGRAGVLSQDACRASQNCLKNKVFTGVCTSLCQTNIDDLLTEKWVDRLIEMGVMYTWFHVYRPMGPDAEPGTVPDARAAAASRQVRRRDAGEEADRHHRCLLRRRRARPSAPPRPASPTTSTRGATSSRARSCSSPRNRSTPRGRHAAAEGEVPAVARSCATSASWPSETTRGCIVLERPDLLKTARREATARRTRRPGRPRWRNWRR